MASETELVEVFRLAEAVKDVRIVADVGDRLAWRWLGVSRFGEVIELTTRSLQVRTGPRTLLAAGQARSRTGDLDEALTLYEQVLPIVRVVGDRAGEAAAWPPTPPCSPTSEPNWPQVHSRVRQSRDRQRCRGAGNQETNFRWSIHCIPRRRATPLRLRAKTMAGQGKKAST